MANPFIDELIKNMPQPSGAGAFGPSAPTVNPMLAPQAGIDQINAAPQTRVDPFAEPQAARTPEERARIEQMVANTAQPAAGGVFNFLFGNPTPEQAQNTLQTQPTDPAQRARLQEIATGGGAPSDLSQAGSFLFGRPDNAVDPHIMGAATAKPPAETAFGLADPSSSTATGDDPFAGAPAPQVAPQVTPQDQQFRLADPTSSTAGLNETQVMLQERFGAPTISAIQAAPEGLGMRTDPQGRMIDPSADRSFFEKESLARDARQEEMLQSRAQSRQDQRGGATGELSMAEATAMTGGDREAARALVVQSRQGTGGVSAKEQAETDKIKAETLGILEQIGKKGTELNLSPAETARDKTAGTALAKWDDSGRATVTSNITALDNIVGGLEDGQIKTRGFIDALPFGSDWARAIMNPEAADAKNRVEGVIFQTLKETLGAQFTEREGRRLVEASYNPMLDPATNAARLRDYSNGLKKAVQARESQMAYLKENKTLQGYDGATPEGIMSQVGKGEGGSPIQGDVDVASAADAIMSAQ